MSTDDRARRNVPEKDLPLTPVTRDEMEEATRQRIDHIAQEFAEGFDLIKHHQKSVTFFGSSRASTDDPYYAKAESLARRIVTDLGYAVVTGGGPGIMEAANKGAYEAGGDSLGLAIRLPTEQALNPYVTEHADFHYFFSRKVCLSFSAEAYVFFPGGFGTMDELFEILTLVQTNKIKRVPIVLVDGTYWEQFDAFIRNELRERGTIDDDDLHLYTVTDNEDIIIDMIDNVPVRGNVPFTHDEDENAAASGSGVGENV